MNTHSLDDHQAMRKSLNRNQILLYGYQALLSLFCVLYLYHQNQKIIAIYDFSYFTDLATRINLNQIPYKDFPVASNPGSFFQLAALLKIFPHNFNAIFIFLSIQSIVVIYCLFWICNRRLKNQKKYLLLLVFLIPLNIYGVFHQPFYDADSLFYVVISSTFILRMANNNLDMKKNHPIILLITGITIFLPFFFKQNIGLAWMIFWVVIGLKVFLVDRNRNLDIIFVFIGLLSSLCVFFAWLIYEGILNKWIYWTILRPFEIRNSSIYILIDGLKQFEKILLLTIFVYTFFLIVEREKNKKRSSQIILIALPTGTLILNTILSIDVLTLSPISQAGTRFYPLIIFSMLLFLFSYALSARSMSPYQVVTLGILVTSIAAMLPQGFYGSTHSLWPLLILAFIFAITEEETVLDKISQRIAVFCLVVNLFVVSTMSLYLVRYDWLPLQNRASVGSKSFGLLKTYGNYLSESEEMASLFLKYKKLGKIAIFPGEEPIAFLTGQVPDVEVSSSDPTTNPWYPNLKGWLEFNSIDYLIYRENGQNISSSEMNFKIISTLQNRFRVIEKIGDYVVYEKIT